MGSRRQQRASAKGSAEEKRRARKAERTARAKKRTAPERPRWRTWTFRFIAIVVIPAVTLLVVEAGLRIFGFGYPTGFALRTERNGVPVYAQNRKFFWRFFPPQIARTPVPFVIPVDKPRDAYRIFVLGASAALGVPDHTYGFGRVLEKQLRCRYPDVDFEVVIAAAVAINSHVVREIAADCMELDPDLFVVYLGNNEVVGPFGAGTVFSPLSPSLGAIRAGLRLKSTRIGQLIGRLAGAWSSGNEPNNWTGLSMFLDKQVPADAPELETVYGHFEQNLTDIVRPADESGVPTLLCTVATNLRDCPPFASLHRADLTDEQRRQWQTIFNEGVSLEDRREWAQALERYRAALDIDDRYAELPFRMGRCLWELGEHDAAHEEFVAARDLDSLRFRADTRINSTIHRVASNPNLKHVRLVDAEQVLNRAGEYDTPGEDLFYEHVHLNFHGNCVLATTIRAQIETLLPERIRKQARDDVDPGDETLCAERLALTSWDRARVIRKALQNYIKAPPFTNQIYQDERVRRFETRLQNIEQAMGPDALATVDSQYRAVLSADPTDPWLQFNYAEFLLEGARNPVTAEPHLRTLLSWFPEFPEALDGLSSVCAARGDYDEAVALAEKVVAVSPNKPAALTRLAAAHRAQGDLAKAEEDCRNALAIMPSYGPARAELAALQAPRQAPGGAAIDAYRRAVREHPDSAEAHYRLALALGKTNDLNEVLLHLREAVRLKPDWPAPAASLAWALTIAPDPKVRNGPAAVDLAERVCRLTEYSAPRFLDVLAAAYAEAGRYSEAVATAEKALSLTDSGNAAMQAERRRRLDLYRAHRPYRMMPGGSP